MKRSCRFVIHDPTSGQYLAANHKDGSSSYPDSTLLVDDPSQATQYITIERAAHVLCELLATGCYSNYTLCSLQR